MIRSNHLLFYFPLQVTYIRIKTPRDWNLFKYTLPYIFILKSFREYWIHTE